MSKTHNIKLYLCEEEEPEAIKLAEYVRANDIRFSCVPMDGSIMLDVDGYSFYGITECSETAEWLIKNLSNEDDI